MRITVIQSWRLKARKTAKCNHFVWAVVNHFYIVLEEVNASILFLVCLFIIPNRCIVYSFKNVFTNLKSQRGKGYQRALSIKLLCVLKHKKKKKRNRGLNQKIPFIATKEYWLLHSVRFIVWNNFVLNMPKVVRLLGCCRQFFIIYKAFFFNFVMTFWV